MVRSVVLEVIVVIQSIYVNQPFSVKHKKEKNVVFLKLNMLTKKAKRCICALLHARFHIAFEFLGKKDVAKKDQMCIYFQQKGVDKKSLFCIIPSKKTLAFNR